MKYKLLIMGSSSSSVADFFRMMGEDFEIISTSMEYEDIYRHTKYFPADMILYILNHETRDNITQMIMLKNRERVADIPIAIMGKQEECDNFTKIAVNVAELELIRPLTASAIKTNILRFMKEREDRLAEENAAKEEKARLAAEADAIAEEVAAEVEAAKPKKHILIIDDDPRMLKVIKRHLEDEYDTAIAISGAIALRFLQNKKTDMILLDYEMPEMDGPEVLEKIRENEAALGIPVVFLTGTKEKEKIAKALSMKPQGYLLKPVDKDSLLGKIHDLIG